MPDHIKNGAAASLVIGVTGHRTLHEDDVARVTDEVRSFFLDLQTRYPALPLVVLSPLAEGGDRLVADVAFELGLRVVAPLPLPVDSYRSDFHGAESVAHLDRQLAKSDVLVLPTRVDRSGGNVDALGHARNWQYAEAGIFVSRHCHILLALWDGHEQSSLGGTAQLVRFHLHGEMAGQVGQQRASLSLLGLDESSLVRHIPTARHNATQASVSDARWLMARDGIVALSDLPESFDRMFRHQATYNADMDRYAKLLDAARDNAPSSSDCPIQRRFVVADCLARLYQRRVRRALRATYAIAGATGAAFIVYAHVHSQGTMIYLYLILFAAGVGLTVLARHRQWHRKYLDYRALAEGLRVQSYWRRSGVVDLENPLCVHENFMQEQDVELGWIRNVLRASSLEGLLQSAHATPADVDAVVDEWIGSPQSNGQLRYFSTTGARRARQHRNAERWALASLAAGIGISVLLAAFLHSWNDNTKALLVVVMGLLSVAAGVHEAYAHKKADKELVKQYRYMERIYGGARRRLLVAADVAEKRTILRVLGEAALDEHAAWALMHRERPLEHNRLGG